MATIGGPGDPIYGAQVADQGALQFEVTIPDSENRIFSNRNDGLAVWALGSASNTSFRLEHAEATAPHRPMLGSSTDISLFKQVIS